MWVHRNFLSLNILCPEACLKLYLVWCIPVQVWLAIWDIVVHINPWLSFFVCLHLIIDLVGRNLRNFRIWSLLIICLNCRGNILLILLKLRGLAVYNILVLWMRCTDVLFAFFQFLFQIISLQLSYFLFPIKILFLSLMQLILNILNSLNDFLDLIRFGVLFLILLALNLRLSLLLISIRILLFYLDWQFLWLYLFLSGFILFPPVLNYILSLLLVQSWWDFGSLGFV